MSARWTPEQTARAEKLWREGQSATTIAKVLACGLTRSAVVGKMTRMGLGRPQELSRMGTRLASWNRGKLRQRGPDAEPAPWLSDAELPPPTVTDTPHARPWMTRRFGECAFPVDGEGEAMRACCAPGRPRVVGSASYCDAHHRAMFVRPSGPVSEPVPRRRVPVPGEEGPREDDPAVHARWDAA